jgi:subtilase family serine protease
LGAVAAALSVSILLAACSGGGSVPSTGAGGQSASALKSAPASAMSKSSRFLPSATSGSPNTSEITYNVTPPHSIKPATVTPGAFPPPSVCIAAFGLACYTPALIRAAYNVPAALDGTGQTIVIVDAYGNPTVRSDLHTFDVAMGLPDPTLNIFYPAGPVTEFPASHHAQSWEFETNLDVQWAHAIAPKATIDLVIVPNNGGNVLNVGQKFAVTNHLGSVMSLSFGSSENAINGRGNNLQLQQADAVYQSAAANNITVFASAGDNGASNGTPSITASFPASDPLVTAVGGTNLFMSNTGTYQNETVWNDSDPALCPFGCTSGVFGATGGAPSAIFAAPSYQQALSGRAERTVSDVSYNASVYTAVLVYVGFLGGNNNGFYFFGGTSEGAPQWAALTALANQNAGHSLGFINPTLYSIGANGAKYAADFHDITVGQNGLGTSGFAAGPGYDIPTGLGSPNFANLVNDL